MKARKVLKFRSYSTGKEEWEHATKRCRIGSYSRISSIKGRLICLLIMPGHAAGIVIKPIYYAAESTKHVCESFACVTWKANYFGKHAKTQAKIELKDALNSSVNVIASPVGQVLQLVKATLGVFHPGAYFRDEMEAGSKNQKTIIIGAGPVGLLTAIQTKVLRPELEVSLVERNEKYERNNRLNLKKRSFAKIPTNDEEFTAIVKSFFGKKNSVSIQTSRIEEELREKAEQLGIKLEHRKVDPTKIENLEAAVVVCADGAHSGCRQYLAEDKAELPLQHIVQMSYEVEGKSKKFSNYRKYPAMKAIGYLVEESVKYDETTGKTAINVRFFVNEADYNVLKGDDKNNPINFKTPLESIESDLLTVQLKNALHLWLNYRQERGESSAESIKITPIGLSIYQSPKFSFDLENGRKAALVGDAASGVPFFRNLNKGVKESSLLAKTIAKSVDYPERKNYYFKRYDRKMRRIAREETRAALSKNVGIKLIDLFTRASSVMPVQTNKIKRAKAEQLKKKPPNIRAG